MENRPDTKQRRETLRQAFVERRRSHTEAIITLRSKLAEPEPPRLADAPPKPGAAQVDDVPIAGRAVNEENEPFFGQEGN